MQFGKTREKNLFLARVAQNIERFEEMLQVMVKHAHSYPALTTAERNMLLVAFKNVLGKRKIEFRLLSCAEKKEEAKSSAFVKLVEN